MKKLNLLFILLLCSCGINSSFSKTCTKEIKNANFSEKTIMYIKYNGNDLVDDAYITKRYKSLKRDSIEIITNIKSSIEEYNNKYGGTGIKYKVLNDELNKYEIKYYLPVKQLDEDVLNDFKIYKNSGKLFKMLKKENMECEG